MNLNQFNVSFYLNFAFLCCITLREFKLMTSNFQTGGSSQGQMSAICEGFWPDCEAPDERAREHTYVCDRPSEEGQQSRQDKGRADQVFWGYMIKHKSAHGGCLGDKRR